MRSALRGSSGPLVIKLAGLAGGIALYDEEMEAAAAAGFRVLALDLSGDRQDDPAPAAIGWDLYADEVATAIAACGDARGILWGTSFGCLVALAVASRRPQVVGGLLLSHPPDPLRRRPLFVGLLDRAERSNASDGATRLAFTAAFYGLTSWEGLMPALWPRLPHLIEAASDAATPASTVRAKLDLLFRDDPGLPPPGAGLPVEIIAGAWDLAAPLAGARRLASRLPRARLTVMGWSGHAGAYTRPRTYRHVTIDALKRLSSRATEAPAT
ncbi:MAG TPA: alpha/beta fold hydrolase [Candidatus Polarisedimenticolaceae bacterium]|nr:alpha/beta fold hydrolase [Candidatus Polarisedimenticolaceae bacterium]